MSAAISGTSSASISESIFAKLDTRKKGYIDEADLKSAAGTESAAASKSAEMIKQVDSDGDGKVTKSELTAAIDKVSEQLNTQLDQSRTTNAAGAKSGAGAEAHGGGGAPPAESGGSDSATAAKYVAAADTNSDGTVSADEAAAYKKAQASADAKAQMQVQEYKNNSGTSEASNSGSVDVLA